MSRVGRFGRLRFRVSHSQILTFKNLQLSQSIKTAEHDIIDAKPKLEITGKNLDEATMDIELCSYLNISPKKQLKTMQRMMESGETNYLIVGTTKVIKRPCIITSIQSSWEDILGRGRVSKIVVNVTFREY